MKYAKVPCWQTGPQDKLLITFPRCDIGFYLVCCTSCGHVYAIDIARQLYSSNPDLDKHLKNTECVQCGRFLQQNWREYPEAYVDFNGELRYFDISEAHYPDDEMLYVELPQLY